MMKQEFEKLAGREVTVKQYKAIEKLYMESSLDKQAFVKSIRGMLKTIPEPVKEKKIIMIGVRDKSGSYLTPNGCWHYTKLAELINVNIKTGKIEVREISNSYDLRYADETYVRDFEVEFVA